jgi:hypothetical protein
MLCESYVPEYNILQWSKIHLVNEAMELDPFNTSLFMWLDGGYAHGEGSVYPSDGVWEPSDCLMQHLHQVDLGYNMWQASFFPSGNSLFFKGVIVVVRLIL